jgi:hypothetical protein
MIFYMLSFIIIFVTFTGIDSRKFYFSVLSHNINKRDEKLYLQATKSSTYILRVWNEDLNNISK